MRENFSKAMKDREGGTKGVAERYASTVGIEQLESPNNITALLE